jgi:hypothetical protein
LAATAIPVPKCWLVLFVIGLWLYAYSSLWVCENSRRHVILS